MLNVETILHFNKSRLEQLIKSGNMAFSGFKCSNKGWCHLHHTLFISPAVCGTIAVTGLDQSLQKTPPGLTLICTVQFSPATRDTSLWECFATYEE